MRIKKQVPVKDGNAPGAYPDKSLVSLDTFFKGERPAQTQPTISRVTSGSGLPTPAKRVGGGC